MRPSILLTSLTALLLAGCAGRTTPTVTEVELQKRLAEAELRAARAEARLAKVEKDLAQAVREEEPVEEPIDTAAVDSDEVVAADDAPEAEAEFEPPRPFAPVVEAARLRS